MMKKFIALAGIAALLLASQDSAPSQAQDKRLSKLMTAKLENAQKLLEGIALSDFKKINSSADALLALTKTEEWAMRKTPRYEMFTNEFQRSLETLSRKAKDKNIDGTTLAFFDMTMSCVRCHQYVREVRDARVAPQPLDGLRLAVR